MTDSKKPAARGPLLAFLVSAFVLVGVFVLVHLLADRIVAGRYPAPEQAAVWSMIGVVVSATVAAAAAAQAWWLIRRR
ncbi:hypothetical protein [Dokdonella sp.]|uniref:hypothetical protein n=1 Tax=Dokdonella sp. TaxID=2291710 RepID=UPI00260677C4|nr:hypothetical protein [Dokdonella sp.]